MPSIARRRTAATLSARRRAENVASSSLGVPVSKAALRTVTSKWSMSMTCMGAWLGGRGLTYGGRHTHPKRKERQRASPPTLYREAASKRIASRLEEELGRQREQLFARGLQRGRGRGAVPSALPSRLCPRALLRLRAGLRPR